MDLILLVITLSVIGFAVWAITEKVPMLKEWKGAIQVLAFLALVLYLITRFFKLPNILS